MTIGADETYVTVPAEAVLAAIEHGGPDREVSLLETTIRAECEAEK